jgi:hypothetical protein
MFHRCMYLCKNVKEISYDHCWLYNEGMYVCTTHRSTSATKYDFKGINIFPVLQAMHVHSFPFTWRNILSFRKVPYDSVRPNQNQS